MKLNASELYIIEETWNSREGFQRMETNMKETTFCSRKLPRRSTLLPFGKELGHLAEFLVTRGRKLLAWNLLEFFQVLVQDGIK